MATVKKVATPSKEAFYADEIILLLASEAADGQEVFHTHFHVIPRYDGRRLGQPSSNIEAPEVLSANAEKIRKALKQDWQRIPEGSQHRCASPEISEQTVDAMALVCLLHTVREPPVVAASDGEGFCHNHRGAEAVIIAGRIQCRRRPLDLASGL